VNNNNKLALKKVLQKDLEKTAGTDVPPEDLKETVFDMLDTLQMIGDFAELFTAKFIKSEAELLNTISSSKKKAP